jgi:hypothetical protein
MYEVRVNDINRGARAFARKIAPVSATSTSSSFWSQKEGKVIFSKKINTCFDVVNAEGSSIHKIDISV